MLFLSDASRVRRFLLVLCADLCLSITNVVAGAALVVLIMIARHPSAITIRKLWKKKKGLLLTGRGNYMTHLGPHSKVASRKKARGPGVLFLLELKVEA